MKTLKVLGYLLTYPRAETGEALPWCIAVLEEEKWVSPETLAGIKNLAAWMTLTDLLDVQEEYVGLFDRTPSLCLHLFEHVHGDSRDRGQALVDLADVYKEKGLAIATEELPDYLPLFLEYLSTLPVEEARDNLDNTVNILASMRGRLEKRNSRYAVVFRGLEDAARRKPDAAAVEAALARATGVASTAAEIDSVWEEQFAFAKPGDNPDAGCPKAKDMVARMRDYDTAQVKEKRS